MLQAIFEHEYIHVAHLEPALENDIVTLESNVELLQVPDDIGKVQIQAIAEFMTSGALSAILEYHRNSYWAPEYVFLGQYDHNHPNGHCDIAEHFVVDPMIQTICNHANSNSWGVCPS